MSRIAALFVVEGGVYEREGVDVWGVSRDARSYPGPFAVVAHPPCERWGRYWHGGPSANTRRILGSDQGCFAAALWAVRQFGGVLEHPEASHAWAYFGLARPPKSGGWVTADLFGGSTCCVEQGHYGHPARKATWLYACHVDTPELAWGPASGKARLDRGFHSAAERRAATTHEPANRLTKDQCVATPPAFAELLLSIARTATP